MALIVFERVQRCCADIGRQDSISSLRKPRSGIAPLLAAKLQVMDGCVELRRFDIWIRTEIVILVEECRVANKIILRGPNRET